jgi:hypothetical protein
VGTDVAARGTLTATGARPTCAKNTLSTLERPSTAPTQGEVVGALLAAAIASALAEDGSLFSLEELAEHGAREEQISAIGDPDLGCDEPEWNLARERRERLVHDASVKAILLEEVPKEVRFRKIGCPVKALHDQSLSVA